MRFMKTAAVALALSVLVVPTAAFAEKGGNHGKGKSKNEARHESRHEGHQEGTRVEFRFGDQDRREVREYYGGQARGGSCPPGLAKKGNGCMPPGQAKKWAMGRPLPHDVVYYELPRDLIIRLPPPPIGHRYVRVAGDVLLIAVGTSMVVDAIQDILR